MTDFDETENELRWRVKPPEQFRDGTFRTIDISDGVKSVVGRLKRENVPKGNDPNAAVTQSFRFDKEKFNETRARAWLDQGARIVNELNKRERRDQARV